MSEERVGEIVDLANARNPISRCCSAIMCARIGSSPAMCRPAPGLSNWPVSKRRWRLRNSRQSRLVVGCYSDEPPDNSRSVRRALAEAGVPLLENQSVRLSQRGRPFWLIGLGDLLAPVPNARHGHGADDLQRAMRTIYDDAPAILLVHEPYFFPWVPDRFALTLAGHMHGGQVNVPIIGPPVSLLKRRSGKYIYGQYALGEKRMIVSGGSGTSLAPIRIVPPEVVMVKLGGDGGSPRPYSNRIGAIEATSNAAIVQLNGRVTRGSLSRRLSEAPNSSPDAAARDRHQGAERGDEKDAVCIAVDDARISRERAQRHHPGLGIDPLKASRGEKPDRPAAGLHLADRLGQRDFQRQPDHINRAGDLHDRQDLREALEQDVESEADHARSSAQSQGSRQPDEAGWVPGRISHPMSSTSGCSVRASLRRRRRTWPAPKRFQDERSARISAENALGPLREPSRPRRPARPCALGGSRRAAPCGQRRTPLSRAR